MRTIIYEKIPSIIALALGFLNFIASKLKDNILLVLVLFLLVEPNADNKGQIVLSFPAFSFKKEQVDLSSAPPNPSIQTASVIVEQQNEVEKSEELEAILPSKTDAAAGLMTIDNI